MARFAPVELQVRDEPGDEDEVEPPAARHLIGDVDLTASRVANLRKPRVESVLDRAVDAKRSMILNAPGKAVADILRGFDSRRLHCTKEPGCAGLSRRLRSRAWQSRSSWLHAQRLLTIALPPQAGRPRRMSG